MEIFGRPGCYVWNPNPQPNETVTWTGECGGCLAQGTGALTWVSDGNEQVITGQRRDGKSDGYTVIRYADGGVSEGPYVNGERNGNWIQRFANGTIAEGPLSTASRTAIG